MSAPTLIRTYQDLRWVDDMDPMAAETASDLESLEQDVFHIIKQIYGSNLDDPNRGVGVENYLGGTSAQLAEVPKVIDAQLLDDPRIDTSKSTLSLQSDGTYLLQVAVGVSGQVVNFNFKLGPNGLSVT